MTTTPGYFNFYHMSTHTPVIKPQNDLIKRARALAQELRTKQASDVDPNEQGVVSAPTQPDGTNKKKMLLPSGITEHVNTTSVPDGVTDVTQPVGTLEGAQRTAENGDAIDARATSPTTPLTKISHEAMAIMNRLRAVSDEANGIVQKQASTPATQESSEYPDVEFMLKVATIMLATESGVSAINTEITRQKGAQVAFDMTKRASAERDEYLNFVKQAAEQAQAQADGFANNITELENLLKTASAEELDLIVKQANTHIANMANIPAELHELYAYGVNDAVKLAAAMEAGGPPMVPGGEGDIPLELKLQVVQQMVESGELDPQTGEELLQALIAEEGGGAPGGGGLEEESASMATGDGGEMEAPAGEKSAAWQIAGQF